jgi:hypothetical protein
VKYILLILVDVNVFLCECEPVSASFIGWSDKIILFVRNITLILRHTFVHASSQMCGLLVLHSLVSFSSTSLEGLQRAASEKQRRQFGKQPNARIFYSLVSRKRELFYNWQLFPRSRKIERWNSQWRKIMIKTFFQTKS